MFSQNFYPPDFVGLNLNLKNIHEFFFLVGGGHSGPNCDLRGNLSNALFNRGLYSDLRPTWAAVETMIFYIL